MDKDDWILKLQQLHNRLVGSGIPEQWYRLHGLFGSTDEDDKLSLEVKKGKYTIEYEVYYKERGEKSSIRTFSDLEQACNYLYDKLIDRQRILGR